MKNLILLLALSTIILLSACDKDPLGIEDNVRIIPLTEPPDTTKPDIKTKFRADTVICEFVEKIKLTNNQDTVSVRWSPLLLDSYAAIDTLGGLKLINFSINAQRIPDTLAEYRKEHILGFHLNMDSFKIVEKYTAEHNNANYTSKLVLQLLPSRKIENVNGNYLFTLTFRTPVYESKKLILRGRFQINVPVNNAPKKYDYIFIGDFIIHFTLE